MSAFTLADLALLRLRNQRLVGRPFTTPAEVVGWLGAVQSQDFAGAKWAVGQRMKRARDATVEAAFTSGEILRTHVLRPTWHFVLPSDIRWMLALTAPRIRAAMRYYDRQLGLDDAAFARSGDTLSRVLEGGKHLTRSELGKLLDAQGQRLGHLLMHAELDALICSGPRRGKQFTYALLEERAPAAPARTGDEALAELTRRYFRSHGPALPQDFAWWSGLTIGDAKRGLELIADEVSQLAVDGRGYWLLGDTKLPRLAGPVVHLLPNYDEHLIAYKERSAAFDRDRVKKVGSRDMVLANHLITLNGRLIGGWRREGAKPIQIKLIARVSADEKRALREAQEQLALFSGD